MMTMTEQTLRQQLLDTSRRMVELGLNRGTAGNASVRFGDGMLITPSAMPVSEMGVEGMVHMGLDGGVRHGGWRQHPLHALHAVRRTGLVRPRTGSAARPQSLPARQPRHDRAGYRFG